MFDNNSDIEFLHCCHLLIFSKEKLVLGTKLGTSNEGWPIQKGCKLTSKTKMWNNGLKGLKQQTSYSSVPLKQTDFLLDRHSQDMGAGWSQSGCLPHPCWLPLFILLSPPFGCAQCKIGLVPTTSQGKEIQMGIHSRPTGNCKLYNNRLCCVCLLTISSVMIRYMYV